MPQKLDHYLQFALQTAHEAGRLTLAHFQTGIQAEYKGDDSPVTIADQKAEELIRQRIGKAYPEHAIVGEEFGSNPGNDKSHCWYIDPIDGTKAFIRGVPLYGVLLGLEIEGKIEVGVVYFPALNEMVYAASGQGTYWNGQLTRVINTERLDRSMVGCTDSHSFEMTGRGQVWQRLQERTYYRAGWSDAYGHALVATGRLEVMLDARMHPWDCAPFPVILREAGGYFGDWAGNETHHCKEAISTTKKLLPEILRIINP